MRLPDLLPALALVLLSTSCAANPGGCPRAGLDLARRCKRLCVVSPGKREPPLSCTCDQECLCWRMPGHVSAPEPSEPIR